MPTVFGTTNTVWYPAHSITIASTTAVTGTAWSHWNYQAASCTSASTTAGWYTWNAVAYAQASVAQWAGWNGGIISERTKKQERREMAAQEHQRREYLERRAKEDEARRQAQQRARALLMTNLTPAQRDSLEKNQFFDIDIGGKLYRIRQGTHGNVRLVENGRETTLFCAQPNGVPTEDAMLAQKLMLETDEAAFLRVANARRL